MHFFYKAYCFDSPLALTLIKEKLNALGPWEWIDRDDERHGDYLSAHIPPDSWLKLYELSAGKYQLDLKLRSSASQESAERETGAVHARVVTAVFPALNAAALVETEVED